MPRDNSFDIGSATHVGYVRTENQDHNGVFETPLGRLMVVADGMGGHQGGALAAQLTVQELQKAFDRSAGKTTTEKVIRKAVSNANTLVYRRANAGKSESAGMGSTVLMLLLAEHTAWIAHVGDSRAYLVRDGRMRRLTKDHTLVQRMVDNGWISEEEARVHPRGNELERAIGNRSTTDMDISSLSLLAGDAVLLCTDGLWAYVTEIEMEPVLNRPGAAQAICEQLIQLALEKGGEDNITVQYLRFPGKREGTDESPKRVTRELGPEVAAAVTMSKGPSLYPTVTIIALVVALTGIALWPSYRHRLFPEATETAGNAAARPPAAETSHMAEPAVITEESSPATDTDDSNVQDSPSAERAPSGASTPLVTEPDQSMIETQRLEAADKGAPQPSQHPTEPTDEATETTTPRGDKAESATPR